jgi:hypothetical protein
MADVHIGLYIEQSKTEVDGLSILLVPELAAVHCRYIGPKRNASHVPPGQDEIAVAQQFGPAFARSQRQKKLWDAGSVPENRQFVEMRRCLSSADDYPQARAV